MKKILLATLLLPAIFSACTKEQMEEIYVQEKYDFSQLPKYPVSVVKVETKNHVPLMALNALENDDEVGWKSDRPQTRLAEIIREEVWENGFGRTIYARSDESIVMENMHRYMYPGSLLDGPSIGNFTYTPITVPTGPVNVSVSFPAKTVTGTIDEPSLSRTRQFLADLMQQEISGQQTSSVVYNIDRFTSYNELKTLFGSNTNTSFLFWGTSSSDTNMEQKVSLNTGLYLQFVQKYFSLDMDIPRDGWIQGNINSEYSPVYVSSLAYGRLGILTLETTMIEEEAERIFKNVVSGLIVNKNKQLTSEERKFFDEATMKVYLAGGDGESGVKVINGPEEFIAWITEGGTFSAQSWGQPIYASFSYLSDHSPFKVDYQIDIDADPLYVKLVQTGTKDNQTYKIQFFNNINGTSRTSPPLYIKFNILRETAYIDYHEGSFTWFVPDVKEYRVIESEETYTQNYFRGYEHVIAQNVKDDRLYYHSWSGWDWGMDWKINRRRYFLQPGRFYKVLAPEFNVDWIYYHPDAWTAYMGVWEVQ